MASQNITACYVTLEPQDKSIRVTATELRGYLGYLFLEDGEFHHHTDNPYMYPLVQYKNIENKLMLIGLQNYASILNKKVSSIDEIVLKGRRLKLSSFETELKTFEVDYKERKYQFVTPWLALNEVNHAKFINAPKKEQGELLKRILAGNVLSAMKGLGIQVTEQITSEFSYLRSVPSKVHGNQFRGFFGEFKLNFLLPDYLGLGKSVSKGFGSVREFL